MRFEFISSGFGESDYELIDNTSELNGRRVIVRTGRFDWRIANKTGWESEEAFYAHLDAEIGLVRMGGKPAPDHVRDAFIEQMQKNFTWRGITLR